VILPPVEEGRSLREIAAELTARGVKTARGGRRHRRCRRRQGGYAVTPDPHVLDRLKAVRRRDESHSAVILRLAKG
jgi:hypothetical protein